MPVAETSEALELGLGHWDENGDCPQFGEGTT